MQVSLKWLNDYIELDNDNIEELSSKITFAGINVESTINKNIDNLVVGKILSVKPHEDSDHLNVCMVDILSDTVQIVCGASNVKEGIKVIVALPGCVLPGNFIIKQSTIRGTQSYGMICALYELGLEEKNDETYSKGICVLDKDAIVGEDVIKYLMLDDIILTLDLNPNRGDCTNHIGFAYEVASVTGKKVLLPTSNFKEDNKSIKDNLSLKVETKDCFLYLLKEVDNIVIKDSPLFIKNRLESCGIRSINNVVDISNYVMLEYGQPLHFFDKDKLGNEILVRNALDKEKLVTLDNVTRDLTKDDIVITNGKESVALAGVMGGLNTMIDKNTSKIVIESALFNTLSVRKTSIKHSLRSEASIRLEKDLNYEYTYEAINRAVYLLEKYASGMPLKDTLIHDETNKRVNKLEISIDKINKMLGINIDKSIIDEIFNKLGFSFEFKDDIYTVTVPRRRMDITIKEDLVEEIGRLYGYDKIVGKLPVLPITKGMYLPKTQLRKDISKRLRNLLLSEVKTYSLISSSMSKAFNNKECLKVLKPMSNDKNTIRTSLVSSLYNVYEYNKARNIKDINIYEIANVYDLLYNEETLLGILISGKYTGDEFKKTTIKSDFYVLKGIIENIFRYLGLNDRVKFALIDKPLKEINPLVSANILIDNISIGYAGKVLPSITKDDVFVLEISLSKLFEFNTKKISFIEPSLYPTIIKDVAFIINKDISYNDILTTIKKTSSLVKCVTPFDIYTGSNIEEDKISIALSLTFSSLIRTLRDDEVQKEFNNIIDIIIKKYGAILRNK
ncbi:MAG: phenylalanine--tRNA ligase subunit beta [Bacilli bacterium]